MICGIFVDVWIRSIMAVLVSSDIQGRTSFCSTFRAIMLISSFKISFWKLPLFNEAISKSHLKNSSDHLVQNTHTENPKIVFDVKAPLRVTRGMERTLSCPSSEPSESAKTKLSTVHISRTNFSKIPSKPFSGLQNLAMEVNLSRRFSWLLITK